MDRRVGVLAFAIPFVLSSLTDSFALVAAMPALSAAVIAAPLFSSRVRRRVQGMRILSIAVIGAWLAASIVVLRIISFALAVQRIS